MASFNYRQPTEEMVGGKVKDFLVWAGSGGTVNPERNRKNKAKRKLESAKKVIKTPGKIRGNDYAKMKSVSWKKYKTAWKYLKEKRPRFLENNKESIVSARRRTADVWVKNVKTVLNEGRQAAMVAQSPQEVMSIAQQAQTFLNNMVGKALTITKKQKKYKDELKKFKNFVITIEQAAAQFAHSSPEGGTGGIPNSSPEGGTGGLPIMPIAIAGGALALLLALKG